MKRFLCMLLAAALLCQSPALPAMAEELTGTVQETISETETTEEASESETTEPETSEESSAEESSPEETPAESGSAEETPQVPAENTSPEETTEAPAEITSEQPCQPHHVSDEGKVLVREGLYNNGRKIYTCTQCGRTLRESIIPVITAAKSTEMGITLTWTKVTSCMKYQVFYRSGNGPWKSLIRTAANTCKVKKLVLGQPYSFRVVCLNSNGLRIGPEDMYDMDGYTIRWYRAPVLKSTAVAENGITLTWTAAQNAQKYRVLMKQPSGAWVSVGDTTGTSFTLMNPEPGKIYTLSAAVLDPDDTTRTGPWNTTGLSACYLAPTTMVSVTNHSGGVMSAAWNEASCGGYQVQVSRTSNFTDPISKNISSAATTSCGFDDLLFDKTYYARVRCTQVVSGKTYYSAWSDPMSVLVTRYKIVSELPGVSAGSTLSAPTVTYRMFSGSSMELSWNSVSGAAGYYVYKKVSTGWQQILSTTDTGVRAVTDDSLKYGSTYTYAVVAYTIKNGVPMTGPATQKKVTMKATAKKSGDYTLYYDENGNKLTDVTEIVGSKSSYLLKVNLTCNTVTVYAKDSAGKYTLPVKSMICSVGEATPAGTFSTSEKLRWHTLMGPSYGQWCTRITGHILFHSMWYYNNGDATSMSVKEYNKLGTTASHGCVRLTAADAKWIYDNCTLKTTVTIYKSSDPGPLGKPSAYKLPSWHTWDPTDPNCQKYCKEHGCHAYA